MLLNPVAMLRIVQEQGEVRVQIKEGTAHEAIRLEAVTGLERLTIQNAGGAHPDSSAL